MDYIISNPSYFTKEIQDFLENIAQSFRLTNNQYKEEHKLTTNINIVIKDGSCNIEFKDLKNHPIFLIRLYDKEENINKVQFNRDLTNLDQISIEKNNLNINLSQIYNNLTNVLGVHNTQNPNIIENKINNTSGKNQPHVH